MMRFFRRSSPTATQPSEAAVSWAQTAIDMVDLLVNNRSNYSNITTAIGTNFPSLASIFQIYSSLPDDIRRKLVSISQAVYRKITTTQVRNKTSVIDTGRFTKALGTAGAAPAATNGDTTTTSPPASNIVKILPVRKISTLTPDQIREDDLDTFTLKNSLQYTAIIPAVDESSGVTRYTANASLTMVGGESASAGVTQRDGFIVQYALFADRAAWEAVDFLAPWRAQRGRDRLARIIAILTTNGITHASSEELAAPLKINGHSGKYIIVIATRSFGHTVADINDLCNNDKPFTGDSLLALYTTLKAKISALIDNHIDATSITLSNIFLPRAPGRRDPTSIANFDDAFCTGEYSFVNGPYIPVWTGIGNTASITAPAAAGGVDEYGVPVAADYYTQQHYAMTGSIMAYRNLIRLMCQLYTRNGDVDNFFSAVDRIGLALYRFLEAPLFKNPAGFDDDLYLVYAVILVILMNMHVPYSHITLLKALVFDTFLLNAASSVTEPAALLEKVRGFGSDNINTYSGGGIAANSLMIDRIANAGSIPGDTLANALMNVAASTNAMWAYTTTNGTFYPIDHVITDNVWKPYDLLNAVRTVLTTVYTGDGGNGQTMDQEYLSDNYIGFAIDQMVTERRQRQQRMLMMTTPQQHPQAQQPWQPRTSSPFTGQPMTTKTTPAAATQQPQQWQPWQTQPQQWQPTLREDAAAAGGQQTPQTAQGATKTTTIKRTKASPASKTRNGGKTTTKKYDNYDYDDRDRDTVDPEDVDEEDEIQGYNALAATTQRQRQQRKRAYRDDDYDAWYGEDVDAKRARSNASALLDTTNAIVGAMKTATAKWKTTPQQQLEEAAESAMDVEDAVVDDVPSRTTTKASSRRSYYGSTASRKKSAAAGSSKKKGRKNATAADDAADDVADPALSTVIEDGATRRRQPVAKITAADGEDIVVTDDTNSPTEDVIMLEEDTAAAAGVLPELLPTTKYPRKLVGDDADTAAAASAMMSRQASVQSQPSSNSSSQYAA